MPPPDEFLPDWDTRPPPTPGRRDVFFLIVLLSLLGLGAILWFTDPAHQPAGKSRVNWPAAKP